VGAGNPTADAGRLADGAAPHTTRSVSDGPRCAASAVGSRVRMCRRRGQPDGRCAAQAVGAGGPSPHPTPHSARHPDAPDARPAPLAVPFWRRRKDPGLGPCTAAGPAAVPSHGRRFPAAVPPHGRRSSGSSFARPQIQRQFLRTAAGPAAVPPHGRRSSGSSFARPQVQRQFLRTAAGPAAVPSHGRRSSGSSNTSGGPSLPAARRIRLCRLKGRVAQDDVPSMEAPICPHPWHICNPHLPWPSGYPHRRPGLADGDPAPTADAVLCGPSLLRQGYVGHALTLRVVCVLLPVAVVVPEVADGHDLRLDW